MCITIYVRKVRTVYMLIITHIAYPSVVKLFLSNDDSTSVVSPSVLRIAVVVVVGCRSKFLRVVFRATVVLHANGVWVERPTGTMNHAALDRLVELGLRSCIRDFCTDYAVDVRSIVKLVLGFQDEEDVGMWQASLLKFDDMQRSDHAAQDMLVVNVVQQRFQLQTENTCNDVRPVSCSLPWLQACSDLGPLGIAGHRNEEVRLAKLGHDCHCILVVLLHGPGAAL